MKNIIRNWEAAVGFARSIVNVPMVGLVEVIKRETISFLCTCEGCIKNWSFYSQADRKGPPPLG